jgi:CubicO group peptidase (beta-lactamase class C family)
MKSILAPLLLSSPLLAQNHTMSLNNIVDKTVAFWNVPGCAVSIVQDNEIILCKGYGIKKLNDPNPSEIDTHTYFPIASLSKAFTTSLLGILIDRGTLTLDTPIRHFYPLKLSDSYAATHLTFRDCLSMRSGLPGPSTDSLLFSDPANTKEKLLEHILPSLPFPLGFRSHFSYQNLLFLLAATPFKPSYHQFLQQELLQPLEMKETLTSHADFLNSSNKVHPHVFTDHRFEMVPYENLQAFLPAAGIISNAHDMTHFLFFLLHHGTYHAKKILSPLFLSEMFTPQTIATVAEFTGSNFLKDVLFPTAQFINYGLGCFIHDYRGIKMIQVPGLVEGVSSVLAIVPSLKLGLFITTNAESVFFGHSLLYQCIDHFLNQKTDWNALFFKKFQAEHN